MAVSVLQQSVPNLTAMPSGMNCSLQNREYGYENDLRLFPHLKERIFPSFSFLILFSKTGWSRGRGMIHGRSEDFIWREERVQNLV